MQKIKFINANGDEIDFTSGCYGVTGWKGLSNANLSLQTQKVPDYDGSVYIDGLLENREIELNLVINDGNNLQTRYEKRQELCKKLNPKLGEGYLYYENDAVQRRIKAISETPIIENKNADESGSVKATLVFDCVGVYWEDVEETEVTLKPGLRQTVANNSDIACSVKVEVNSNGAKYPCITNFTTNKKIEITDTNKSYVINTGLGQKNITEETIQSEFIQANIAGYTINKVIYVGVLGLYVAVGSNGAIFTSIDGSEWIIQASGTSNNIYGICYSDSLNLFVAVGFNVILVSSDVINWTCTTNSYNNIKDVAYSDYMDLFFVVGSSGLILTSSDGENWTEQTSGITSSLNSIAYSPFFRTCIAVGDNGVVISSINGIQWTQRTSGVTTQLNRIVWANDVLYFVAVGASGVILKSSLGAEWSSETSGITDTLYDVVYSRKLGLFVAVGASGVILTRENGQLSNWISRTSGVTTYLNGVIFSEILSTFVVVGASGTVLLSDDGLSWDLQIYNAINTFNAIGYSKSLNLLVIVGYTGLILTSPDGENWTQQISETTSNLYGIVYSEDKGLFVAVGASGVILISSNGENWTQQISETTSNLYGIVYSEDKGLFVAVGGNGVIFTSSDGITWTSRTSNVSKELHGVIYSEDKGLFVAVGGDTNIAGGVSVITVSSDGITWTVISDYLNRGIFYNVIYSESNECFIAVGFRMQSQYVGYGVIAYSTNGLTWSYKDDSNAGRTIVNFEPYIVTSGTNFSLINFNEQNTEQIGIFATTQNGSCVAGNVIYTCGNANSIYKLTKVNGGSLINKITEDSNMGLTLQPGDNVILLSLSSGSIQNSRLTYRQRYIGV